MQPRGGSGRDGIAAGNHLSWEGLVLYPHPHRDADLEQWGAPEVLIRRGPDNCEGRGSGGPEGGS